MIEREVTIVNALGLHARAAAKFVRLASGFRSVISVTSRGQTMDGKSILGLLLLAAARGVPLTIAADGIDETDAIATLTALVARGFDET